MKEMIKLKMNKDDVKYFGAVLVLFDYMMRVTFNNIRLVLGIGYEPFADLLFYSLFTVLFLISTFYMGLYKREIFFVFIYYGFFGFYYIYTMIVSPLSLQLQTGFSVLHIFLYFPAIIILYLGEIDYRRLLKLLVYAARIFSVVVILTMVMNYYLLGFSFEQYDMVMGYQAALCEMFIIYSLSQEKNTVDIILLILLTALVLLMGSRGSLLILACYLMIVLLKKYFSQRLSIKKIVLFMLAVVTIAIVFIEGKVLLEKIALLASGLNINARTIKFLLGDDFSTVASDQIRYELRNKCVSQWGRMPALGYGILGDRQFLEGDYVHNIFIEFITDYGFVLGTILIVTLLYGIIKNIAKKSKIFAILLLSLSGSYLTSTLFFVLLSVIVNTRHTVKKTEV